MAVSNTYKAIFYEHPDYIPVTFMINDSCWHHYPQEWLCEQLEKHKFLFPNFKTPKLPFTPAYGCCAKKDEPLTDSFGCVWYTTDDGITGMVLDHPLADWENFKTYQFPDPDKSMGLIPYDWNIEKENIAKARARGDLVWGGLRHGHTFMQLSDIRGYENLMYDMADENPLLWKLIDGVEAFNTAIVKKYLDFGVDIFGFPEDLGMQHGPMVPPEYFRKYIKPSYKRMMDLVRDKGIPIHMHSDGDIRTLADDIVDSGVVVLNLQDLVNGIEWIRDKYRGKICIDLDIDRQNITRFGTPEEVDHLVRYEVEQLSTKEGGLMIKHDLYPGIPLENVEALMDAMERYAHYYD